MIDFKKFKFGRKKQQDDTASPANAELPVKQPVHFVEQDVVELDLDDQSSGQPDDVLARLGFKTEEKNNTEAKTSLTPEDDLQFPKIPISSSSSSTGSSALTALNRLNQITQDDSQSLKIHSQRATDTPSSLPHGDALDALQEERKRNLERLRASIIQSTTASLELPKEPARDEFFKTKEESLLEKVQEERKRDLEELRANIAQSTLDLNRIATDSNDTPKPRSLDEEFLQFKQAEHRSKAERERASANSLDEEFAKLKNTDNAKEFSSLDDDFARFKGLNEFALEQQNQASSYEPTSFAKPKPANKKKRMITVILGVSLLAGGLVAVKHYFDKSEEPEGVPDVVITPTTPAEDTPAPPETTVPPIPDGSESVPAEQTNVTDTPSNVPATDTPPVADPSTTASTTTAPAVPSTTPPTAQPVINVPQSKVLVDDSILKQPVASDPTLIEEELAKLNELEKQLTEQQANLEAQHQDAEKLIKLKEERIRLLEAQLENKLKGQK